MTLTSRPASMRISAKGEVGEVDGLAGSGEGEVEGEAGEDVEAATGAGDEDGAGVGEFVVEGEGEHGG